MDLFTARAKLFFNNLAMQMQLNEEMADKVFLKG